jgi:hypothetical protein
MDDWHISANAKHSRVQPMSILGGRGREADLVVAHYMDCACCRLVIQISHLQ